ERLEGIEKRRILQPLRLEDRNVGSHGARLHGSVGRPVPAPAGPIGLRDDADDAVARGEQRVERGDRELGGSKEDDPQTVARYHLPARVSFRILRTMRSRLMPRKRSTN